jgi:acetyltransferase
MIEVDIGDLLDFFALDRPTRAILLYIESIKDARKFMSAARAAARTKPVVVVKSGRHALAAKAAQTHTGALAGADAVYEAAFLRAGLLRVLDLEDLFAAAEALGRVRPFAGNRLAILTNGGGIGVLAVDRLVDFQGTLASMASPTLQCLDAVLPPTWSRSNPIDIVGDADAARYAAAFEILLTDPGSDAILAMNVPTALASATESAQAITAVARKHAQTVLRPKPTFAVWIGQEGTAADAFESVGIPHFENESDAIGSFMHLVRYRQAMDALLKTPPSLPADFSPDAPTARAIVRRAVEEKRTWLDPLETAGLLRAYSIPIAPVVLAADADAAARAAAPMLGRGRSGGVENSLSRHRAQVGSRRRPSQSRERARGPRGRGRNSGDRAPTKTASANSRRHGSSNDREAQSAGTHCRDCG